MDKFLKICLLAGVVYFLVASTGAAMKGNYAEAQYLVLLSILSWIMQRDRKVVP